MSEPIIDVEEAFRDFLEEYGAEVSDKILIGPNLPTNPDYIFHDAKIIAELKLLKTDPFKNKEFIKSFEDKQRNWIRKGHITQQQLILVTKIDQLPDFCYRDILKLYGRSIKTHIIKANKQIKAMKERRGLLDYKGLLLLGNDGNYFIEPRNAARLIGRIMTTSPFSSINTVVYFTVNMVTTHPNDRTLYRLWINLYRQIDDVPVSFLNDLSDKWVLYFKKVTGIEIENIRTTNEEGYTEQDLLKDTEYKKPSG